MASHPLSERFLEGTQGRLIALLRLGPRTVEELATELGLTRNAVRLQLAALERDGLARVEGSRPSGRKPALVYGLTSRTDFLLSRSYVPVLRALLDALGDRLLPAERLSLLREVGRRLAVGLPRATGNRRDRLAAAGRAVEMLGGRVSAEADGKSTLLIGAGCPLGEVVRDHPDACRIVESLIHEITGVKVQEHCDRGERPRCSFRVE